MGTKIQIMDLEVDLLSEETLEKEFLEYLSNDYLNVAHIVSVEAVEAQIENEEVRQEYIEADMILPGEKSILLNHHVDVLETGGMVVDYHSIAECLRRIDFSEKKIYFVMRNKKEAKAFMRIVLQISKDIECVGVCIVDENFNEQSLINDINTKIPDVICVSMNRGDEEHFILENKNKLNAKLCFCSGTIAKLLRSQNPYIPKVIKALHLTKIYKWFLNVPNSYSLRKRIFKTKMADYNSKKENEDA